MRISSTILGFAVAPLCLLGLSIAQTPKSAKKVAVSGDQFAKEVLPLVQKYCVSCHTAASPAGGVNLENEKTLTAMLKNRGVWERAAANVGGNVMPPEGMPHPNLAEREKIVSIVQSNIAKADCALRDPGKVVMRRLNREEYNNTIRDLTGLALRPADDFPSDDVGYGFDNIGDVLALSPLLMEKYLNAAEIVSKAAVVTPEGSLKPILYDMGIVPESSKNMAEGGTVHFFGSESELTLEHNFARPGDYLIRAKAAAQQAGDVVAKMAVKIDGQNVKVFDVPNLPGKPKEYEIRVDVTEGKHKIGVAFLNDFYVAETKYRKAQDRNLLLYSVEVSAPKGLALPITDSHKKIFGTRPAGATDMAYAKQILSRFARKAYRRPASPDELGRLVKCVTLAEKEGESFERGIQLGVQVCLSSPNFIFHAEPSAKPVADRSVYLGQYEMASRLSYFLWSSMPDEELLALAGQNKLQDPTVLETQIKRMLKDTKAKALSANFAGQWLQLRNLSQVAPNRKQFTGFNNDLRNAMKSETELFFDGIVREDRSVLEFLDAKYTYLNEVLAKHYGIEGVQGDNFRKVSLASYPQRGGLLTQASILTVTSNPTRTSPVKRGKWVMEQILGTPLPPAPPNVPTLPDDKKEPLKGTLRQRMEQHRANPSCASCHARMDPIGFGMENYDAVGGWRTKDGETVLDTSGKLPTGQTFTGPNELKTILMQKKNEFARCLTEKLLTYSIGRGVQSTDRCNLDAMTQTIAKENYKFSALVTAIVLSEPFRKQRIDNTIARGGTAK